MTHLQSPVLLMCTCTLESTTSNSCSWQPDSGRPTLSHPSNILKHPSVSCLCLALARRSSAKGTNTDRLLIEQRGACSGCRDKHFGTSLSASPDSLGMTRRQTPRLAGVFTSAGVSLGKAALCASSTALRVIPGLRAVSAGADVLRDAEPVGDDQLRAHSVMANFPQRTFAFDEFGALAIHSIGGCCWGQENKPQQVRANFRKTCGRRES